jgi:predicted O-linked N-acetylglucosamine transferase (SPINDLY family)
MLTRQGKFDETIAEIKQAIRLNADVPEFHTGLGSALQAQRKVNEAIAEYREAVRLNPNLADSHVRLGVALNDQGKAGDAIAEYREAIRLKPDLARAHALLAFALRDKGELTEAMSEMRKARDFGKVNPRFTQGIEGALAELEQMVALDKKLPSVLSGHVKPTSAAEVIGFAKLCQRKKLYGASARFWAEAFRSDRTLADDANARNRYNAACAAVLAASSQGKAEPPLDLGAQARLRRQALDWLKAELAAWNTRISGNDPQARADAERTLKWWQADTDLARVRGSDALARLPESEGKDWQTLWADVEALLKRSRGG